MIELLRRQHAHLRWADLRVLEAVSRHPDVATVRLLAHVLAADLVWITRLQGRDSGHLQVWPELTLRDCEELAVRVHRELGELLDRLSGDQLEEIVPYRNQTGTEQRASRSDILTHLMMHGAYHRGQIAQGMRLAGREPVNTDYIAWVREQQP